MTQQTIEIQAICRKILRNTVLDIFYLIMEEKDITKSDIAHRFAQHDPDLDAKVTKYRGTVDVGIAKLEGAMFIDHWEQGQSNHYYLTTYGKQAMSIMEHLIIEDPLILNGSKITAKVMTQD
ncbi:hypothetical protein [Paenibacillus prosopidis]|uniref:Transcriptional regulator n=1 Tax=Paenibacillus prosopidis TaxID=630520 RepID=A0A368VQS7_9BACL|nr:hypothetical protein [Paenibacillus prosopidis]RCW41637.1 hypothetical protein DFP97_12273 [Paenibacillus prosopidis]